MVNGAGHNMGMAAANKKIAAAPPNLDQRWTAEGRSGYEGFKFGPKKTSKIRDAVKARLEKERAKRAETK